MSKRFLSIAVGASLTLAAVLNPSATASTSLIPAASPAYAASFTAAEPAAFYRALYDNMTARHTSFSINYIGISDEVFDGDMDKLLSEVYAINDLNVSWDGDYLKYNIKSVAIGYAMAEQGCEFIFDIAYMETPEQLDLVNQKTAAFIATLAGLSNHDKVAAIHDFVVEQVNYDQTLTKFTAYDALVNHSAVCQGYTLLTYKLLTEAGFPCRYIEGFANNEHHSWNIVFLDGKWYAIDTTWDDIIVSNDKICRDYFLIGSNKLLRDHTPDTFFQSEEFQTAFPLSPNDYPY